MRRETRGYQCKIAHLEKRAPPLYLQRTNAKNSVPLKANLASILRANEVVREFARDSSLPTVSGDQVPRQTTMPSITALYQYSPNLTKVISQDGSVTCLLTGTIRIIRRDLGPGSSWWGIEAA